MTRTDELTPPPYLRRAGYPAGRRYELWSAVQRITWRSLRWFLRFHEGSFTPAELTEAVRVVGKASLQKLAAAEPPAFRGLPDRLVADAVRVVLPHMQDLGEVARVDGWAGVAEDERPRGRWQWKSTQPVETPAQPFTRPVLLRVTRKR